MERAAPIASAASAREPVRASLRPLVVVLLNQYYPPSDAPTGLLVADLAERLASRGHDVTVIASRRAYEDPRRSFARSEERRGVRVRRVRTTGFGRAGAAGRLLDYGTFLAGATARLGLGRRPDVVVTLSTPPMLATAAVAWARARRARSVYWVMDVYPEVAFALGVLGARSLAGRVLTRLARYALCNANRVIALGDLMAEALRAHGADPVEVVPNWVAGEPIAPDTDATALRAEWGWTDQLVVLYSGNLGLAYEFDTAIRAAERLRDRSDIRFAFVGSGPRRAEVEADVRRRALANVEFREPIPRERLAEGLAAGDVHLVTLRAELAGLLVPSKIYGTLAAARPTLYVGPAESEVGALIAGARCGIRIEPGDAAALADAIRAYADDPERRRADGQRARLAHDDRFAPGRSLDRMVRVVEDRP